MISEDELNELAAKHKRSPTILRLIDEVRAQQALSAAQAAEIKRLIPLAYIDPEYPFSTWRDRFKELSLDIDEVRSLKPVMDLVISDLRDLVWHASRAGLGMGAHIYAGELSSARQLPSVVAWANRVVLWWDKAIESAAKEKSNVEKSD